LFCKKLINDTQLQKFIYGLSPGERGGRGRRRRGEEASRQTRGGDPLPRLDVVRSITCL